MTFINIVLPVIGAIGMGAIYWQFISYYLWQKERE